MDTTHADPAYVSCSEEELAGAGRLYSSLSQAQMTSCFRAIAQAPHLSYLASAPPLLMII